MKLGILRHGDAKPPKEPKIKNKGYFQATYFGPFAAAPYALMGLGAMGALNKVTKVSDQDIVTIRKATQEGLKQSGLYEKGVRVFHFEEVSPKQVIKSAVSFIKNPKRFEEIQGADDIFSKVLGIEFGQKDRKALGVVKEELNAAAKKMTESNKLFKMKTPENNEATAFAKAIGDVVTDVRAKMSSVVFKTGQNAGYFSNANKIITPEKSLQVSVFHEMGHALNNNGGVVLKTLQKVRPASLMLSGTILSLALLNKRKVGDEKSDNKLQRVFDGFKKHAPLLTGLVMLPMVAEEGIASLRGDAIARNLVKEGKLTKELLKKVRVSNLLGFSTYLFSAIAMAASCKGAIKVKDKVQAKYEAKQMQKYQEKLAKFNEKQSQAKSVG